MGFFRLGKQLMQILHYLPSENQLILDNLAAQAMVDLLIVPFGTREKAKEFWQEYPSTIVVFNRNDNVEQCLKQLSDVTRLFVETAHFNPEFIEDLPDSYRLSLAITSDSGNGLYLIKPASMAFK
jgi:hypothetical protein